ncbi:hypothetical protein KIW84_035896 [Lathyrus oleraceus]|uniref:Uncharacterized protein n=1 Tax=Pisum sativum TaxID=3888 RepID=A0A9D4Y510_PEA|nr:hypothetical protein KIW84_035896 [Pisum sativum]
MIASSGHHLGSRTPSVLSFPVNGRYIERHCVPRKARVRNAQASPAQQQVLDKRVACSYTWDMLEANQRAFMFMHDYMNQLLLQIREPHVDHSLGTRDEF